MDLRVSGFDTTWTKAIKDSFRLLKCENKDLRDAVADISKRMTDIERENEALREQVDFFQKEKSSSCLSSQCDSDATDSLEQKIRQVNHKFKKAETTVKSIKKETCTRIQDNSTRLQEVSSRLNQLQRVFNTVHVSLQSRKDLQEDINDLRTEVNTLKRNVQTQADSGVTSNNDGSTDTAAAESISASSDNKSCSASSRQHPSRRGVSRSEALKILELTEKSEFHVALEETPLIYDTVICIEKYTIEHRPSVFMDIELGVYKVSLKGTYEFYIGSISSAREVSIFICRDRDDLCLQITGNRSQDKSVFYYSTTEWKCEKGDLVWLEAIGVASGKRDKLRGLVFKGRCL